MRLPLYNVVSLAVAPKHCIAGVSSLVSGHPSRRIQLPPTVPPSKWTFEPDVTLVFDNDETIRVHREILNRCTYFSTMFRSGMTETEVSLFFFLKKNCKQNKTKQTNKHKNKKIPKKINKCISLICSFFFSQK